MDFTNKTIFNDDDKYIVVEGVKFDGKTYIFITNPQDKNDSKFVEVEENNDGVTIRPIDPTLFKSVIFPLFVEKFEKY